MTDRLLEVGTIAKPHGVRGDVLVTLLTDREERLTPGARFHTDRGLLTVVSSQRHGERFIVRFAEIVGREAAEQWRGTTLHAEPPPDDGTLWVDSFFGATLETADGTVRGVVTSVERGVASDLLVLDTGALVPVTFVTTVEAHRRVVVDPPEGLFE